MSPGFNEVISWVNMMEPYFRIIWPFYRIQIPRLSPGGWSRWSWPCLLSVSACLYSSPNSNNPLLYLQNEHSTANDHIERLHNKSLLLYMYLKHSAATCSGHNVTLIPTFQSSIPFCDRLQSGSSPVHVTFHSKRFLFLGSRSIRE